MGADSKQLIMLITRDFTTLVTVSIVLGIPISWYLLEKLWLTQFAYRVELGAIPFVGAASMCFALAFITAGYQAIKASWADPIKTLRTE
jgi:putative ABC transport system permease protein